ncbi:MAG: hypothetical protein WAM66_04045 [Acidobacteriaceae bacterium]
MNREPALKVVLAAVDYLRRHALSTGEVHAAREAQDQNSSRD